MDLDLGAPATELTRLIAGVRDEQLGDPTPSDISVGELIAHILGLSVAFRDGARKVDGPTTSTPPGRVELPADWRDQAPGRLAELAEAWRDPSAWTGETTVGGVRQPAPVLAGFANDELVVHGWDLAIATDQSYGPAEANVEAAWQLVSQIPDDPQARTGLFGPRRPVAEDASTLDRLLSYAGRDPRWTA